MSELDTKAQIPPSLWHNNPSLVQLLGLSPLMAVSDSASKGAALALGTLLVCIFSATAIHLLRRFIDEKWRYLWFSIILASIGTFIILLLQLYWYPLSRELGVYSVLIVCNLALLLQMDNYYQQHNPAKLLGQACSLGIALLLALVLFSMLREFIISGAVFSQWQLLIPNNPQAMASLSNTGELFRFAKLQPAGLILLGLLIALGNSFGAWRSAPLKHRQASRAKRARVSGRLKKDE